MGLFRTILTLIVLYFIFKVFMKLIAPVFAGYYEKDTGKARPQGQSNKQKVNNIVIDTSKAKSNLQPKPDINRIDAEDIDFEEIK